MKRFKRTHLYILLSTLFLILGFQNCNKTKMTSIDESSLQSGLSVGPDSLNEGSEQPQPGPHEEEECDHDSGSSSEDPGLEGGHFDLDTSSATYAFDKGTTDHHVHEYDNKFNVKQVDFYNLLDKEFTKISSRVTAGQEFIVVVANAELSPGAILELNGEEKPVVPYQGRVDSFINGNSSALATYTLASLKSFKLKFASSSLNDNILVPTDTKCVRANNDSVRGEYRNGALTIQLIEKSSAQLDAKTRVAKPGGGLLWEATVFWHKDSTCQ